MWLLDRKRDVLRLGRECAQYWVRTSAGLLLCGRLTLAAKPGADAGLEAELLAWLQGLGSEISRTRPIDVVLESAWLPVMVIEVGSGSWRRTQVASLLQHRMSELHLYPGVPLQEWHLQIDHRPGDEQALGYGLAPSIRQAVLGATAAADRRAASLQPALAWGRARLARRARSLRTGWWIWIEHDRALVCRIERSRVTAMNAGACVPGDEAQCARLIAIEAAREGIVEPSETVVMAGWLDLAAPAVEASLLETQLRRRAEA